MRFKISCIRNVRKTNINGKPLKVTYECRVYKSFLFGLIRRYINIYPTMDWKECNSVRVMFRTKDEATVFDRNEAKELLAQIKKNPDKFVVYL